MIPSVWVGLDELPLNATGKLDRKALPEPGGHAISENNLPRTPAEAALCEVWTRVLGIPNVGIHDNFFDLGGDSIISIQIAAHSLEHGLKLTVRDIFDHPTVAALANVARPVASESLEESTILGPVPLTPIQSALLEREPTTPHHYTQAVMLECRQLMDPEILRVTLKHLVQQHDALRLRVSQEGHTWRQAVGPADDTEVFTFTDLSESQEHEAIKAVETIASGLALRLHLNNGPLLAAAMFRMPAGTRDRLALVIHHFAVDGVSWRILIEDLETAYQQLKAGDPVNLPPRTAPFVQWAAALNAYVDAGIPEQEQKFWMEQSYLPEYSLPVDHPNGENLVGSEALLTAMLSPIETARLLRDAPKSLHCRVEEALIMVLAEALRAWTGRPHCLIDLESHGRQELVEGLDVSRTVGWFTAVYPVEIRLEDSAELPRALKGVKDQLRAIPRNGIGYGLLRYLSPVPSVREALEKLPRPQICFNYLGQTDALFGAEGLFSPGQEHVGSAQVASRCRPYILEVVAFVHDARLQVNWLYSRDVHNEQTVERLAGEFVRVLRDLLAPSVSPSGSLSASDFKLPRMDGREFEKALGEIRKAQQRKKEWPNH
jgi:non-ribosomal peptide synthase protein (TIGR01720 family)